MSSIATFSESPKHPKVKFIGRPSEERGSDELDWLKISYSFNFEIGGVMKYSGAPIQSFGSLNVLNEIFLEPSHGFEEHGDRNMEVFTYMVSGELEHIDSMGNSTILKRGNVQINSSGTGISHSEFNHDSSKKVHLLQMWAHPKALEVTPKYNIRHFTDKEKTDKLALVIAPSTSNATLSDSSVVAASINSDISLYATILSPTSTVTHTFLSQDACHSESHRAYVHVIQTSGYNAGKAVGARVQLNGGMVLAEGDGAYVWGNHGEKVEFQNVGVGDVEFLVFDIT